MFDSLSRSLSFSRRLNSSRRGAFSLLEVAFALVIFVIGALALLRIFPGGLDVLEDTGNRRVAAQMSQNVLTSYKTGGDLAVTTPDAIFDGDINTNGLVAWNDYPLSLTGLRRDKGTVPDNIDNVGSSALDHLRLIHSERQNVINGVCFTNYVVDRRRVNVFREGLVEGVKLVDATSGKLDFRGAHYPGATNPLPFREPMIVAGTLTQSGVATSGASIKGGAIELPRPDTAATLAQTIYVIPFKLDDSRLKTVGITSSISSSTPPNGSGVTVAVNATDVTVTVDNANASGTANPMTDPPTPQPEVEFQITVTPPEGASVDYQTYVVHVPASTGGTALTTHLATPQQALIVRAPYQMRDKVRYFVSTEWSNGGAYNQPFQITAGDASYGVDGNGTSIPIIPSVRNGSAPFALAHDNDTLTFRQFIQPYGTGTSTVSDRVRVDLTSNPTLTYNDVGDTPPLVSSLTQVALDYNVYSWDYLTEYTSQFGTPFPGSTVAIPETPASPTADEMVWTQFINDESKTQAQQTSITRSDLAELRTSIGNLRGPIYIKGIYKDSTGANAFSTDVQFDPRDTPSNYASLSAQQQRDFRKRMADSAKQGRFYSPALISTVTPPASLQSARLYYRSRDSWAQQIGVAAFHYLPYSASALVPEPWREYFHASDGYVYFHAAEAGKSLTYTYKSDIPVTSILTGVITHQITYPEASLEVKPDILFLTALPTGMPATFTTQKFNNTDNANDPRNGKFYLARSRDTVANPIYDIRRVSGSSGISVRTLWLNSNRYAEEIAQ